MARRLAALLASACFLGPLVLVTLGVSGAWIGNLKMLEPYRPLFPGAALIAMFFAYRRISSTPTQKYRNMGKPMDSRRWLGAKRSDTRRYREHLQRRHRREDAVSRFDISGLAY